MRPRPGSSTGDVVSSAKIFVEARICSKRRSDTSKYPFREDVDGMTGANWGLFGPENVDRWGDLPAFVAGLAVMPPWAGSSAR